MLVEGGRRECVMSPTLSIMRRGHFKRVLNWFSNLILETYVSKTQEVLVSRRDRYALVWSLQ